MRQKQAKIRQTFLMMTANLSLDISSIFTPNRTTFRYLSKLSIAGQQCFANSSCSILNPYPVSWRAEVMIKSCQNIMFSAILPDGLGKPGPHLGIVSSRKGTFLGFVFLSFDLSILSEDLLQDAPLYLEQKVELLYLNVFCVDGKKSDIYFTKRSLFK